jgi:hypothetical protein
MMGDDHPTVLHPQAETDQIIADFRSILTDLVRAAREHDERGRCKQYGCPGGAVINQLNELVSQGPGVALTALALAVHFLARKEDLLEPDELEGLFDDGNVETEGLLEGQVEEGESTPGSS